MAEPATSAASAGPVTPREPAGSAASAGPVTSAERLAAFEAFAAEARAELAEASARMEELRAAGKVKTATYQQLFANRATLRQIDARLRERGL